MNHPNPTIVAGTLLKSTLVSGGTECLRFEHLGKISGLSEMSVLGTLRHDFYEFPIKSYTDNKAFVEEVRFLSSLQV